LTFDAEHPDRPNEPGVQERLLELLARERVPATFFLQGRWVEAYPQTAGLVVQAGHLIGSHSFYHARMPLFSDDGFDEDVRSAERALVEIVGVDPRPWFRCPLGEGAYDPRVLARLDAAEVPCGPVASVKELFEDPQVRARDNILEFPSPLGGLLAMVGIVPRLTASPGRVESAGPVTVGADNEEIYCGRLGLTRDDLRALSHRGVV